MSIKHIKCYQRRSSGFTYIIIIVQLRIQIVIRTVFLLFERYIFPKLKKKKTNFLPIHIQICFKMFVSCSVIIDILLLLFPQFPQELKIKEKKKEKNLPCLVLCIVPTSSVLYSYSLVGQKCRLKAT